MTIARKFATATTVALLAASGIAAAADAPVVGDQQTSRATHAPVTIAGTGVKKGDRLPDGARLVYRDVTLEGDQKVTFNIGGPNGKTVRGIAPKTRDVGFRVLTRGDYAGRTKVKVQAFLKPNADGEQTSRIYGLVR